MDPTPRKKLCEIIKKYGIEISRDHKRCEAFLKDFCGEYKREISVLVCAIQENVTCELIMMSNHTPLQTLTFKLSRRLQDNKAISEEAAMWAVKSATASEPVSREK